jgi:hypothetical protein
MKKPRSVLKKARVSSNIPTFLNDVLKNGSQSAAIFNIEYVEFMLPPLHSVKPKTPTSKSNNHK